MGRGGVRAPSPAELPDRPGQRGLASRNPPTPRRLLPSSPHRLLDAWTPEPSRRPAAGGFPELGAVLRNAPPPPLSGDLELETESQTDAFARAHGGKGSSADPHPDSVKHVYRAPRIQPARPGTTPEAFADPGWALPLFLAFMVGPGQTPSPCACPPCPSWPSSTWCRVAGLRARSQQLWLGLQLLPAPPPPTPAQFLPPYSARRDGAGLAGPGGAPGLQARPASGRGDRDFPWEGSEGVLLGWGQECR